MMIFRQTIKTGFIWLKFLDGFDGMEAKKCRARFGLDQQAKWCKHCRFDNTINNNNKV